MQTPFGTWLHVSASAGSWRVTEYLLSIGLDSNARGGTFGGSAINVAAGGGHIHIVVKLLESGAILDTSEPERNPLFSAIYGGRIDIVKLLVERGIDKGIKYSGSRMTNMDALRFAIERGQTAIADYLRSLENAA